MKLDKGISICHVRFSRGYLVSTNRLQLCRRHTFCELPNSCILEVRDEVPTQWIVDKDEVFGLGEQFRFWPTILESWFWRIYWFKIEFVENLYGLNVKPGQITPNSGIGGTTFGVTSPIHSTLSNFPQEILSVKFRKWAISRLPASCTSQSLFTPLVN